MKRQTKPLLSVKCFRNSKGNMIIKFLFIERKKYILSLTKFKMTKSFNCKDNPTPSY